jgi:hypothetical protein
MIGGRIGIHASAQKVDVGFIARLCAGLRGGRLNSTVGGVCELCLHIEKALPVLSRACSPDSDPLPTGVILGTAHLGAPCQHGKPRAYSLHRARMGVMRAMGLAAR